VTIFSSPFFNDSTGFILAVAVILLLTISYLGSDRTDLKEAVAGARLRFWLYNVIIWILLAAFFLFIAVKTIKYLTG
jgi:hypothetical protein